jgi:hypothetical protein
MIIIVSLVCLVILIITISKISANKKIREEEERIVKIKNDLVLAVKNGEILNNHYDEIASKLGTLNSSQLLKIFDLAKKQKQRFDYLLSKYNENQVIKIMNHEYWIGMTEEQLLDCKGKPDKIDLEQLKTKTKKIYIYGNKSSGDVFNFVDGILERFKDR